MGACNPGTAPEPEAPSSGVKASLQPPSGPEAPNAVVLITIDTLRADRTSFGGYDKPTTPFLEGLSKKGIVFTQAHATSSTTPLSMASIFTGLHPTSHGFNYATIDPSTDEPVQPNLHERFLTIGETMKSLGYATVGSTSNNNLATQLNFSQGFDHYTHKADFCKSPKVNRQARGLLKDALGEAYSTRWRDTKLFLWLHYFDPHEPYFDNRAWRQREDVSLSEEDVERFAGKGRNTLQTENPNPSEDMVQALNQLYDGEIRFTDDAIRNMWNLMGFDDNTLLIVTSDHGEEFGEHNAFGHAQNLYQETVHVPLFIHWPKGLPQGLRIEEPVSILDIYPTLLSILGAPPLEALQGVDLMPAINAKHGDPSRRILMELNRRNQELQAMRRGDKKAIKSIRPHPKEELYDLKKTPTEQHNLAIDQPTDISETIHSMTALFDALPEPPPLKTTTLRDQEEIEQLKSMGYLE